VLSGKQSTIIIYNTEAGLFAVNDQTGVRVMLGAGSSFNNTEIQGNGNKLEVAGGQEGDTKGSFGSISVNSSGEIEFKGDFGEEDIVIQADNASVKVAGGTKIKKFDVQSAASIEAEDDTSNVGNVTVSGNKTVNLQGNLSNTDVTVTGNNATLAVGNNTQVKNVDVAANATVSSGTGSTITNVAVTTSGTVNLQGNLSNTNVTVTGNNATLAIGNNTQVKNVDVAANATVSSGTGSTITNVVVTTANTVTLQGNMSSTTVSTTTDGAGITLGANATVNKVEVGANTTLSGEVTGIQDVTVVNDNVTVTGVDALAAAKQQVAEAILAILPADANSITVIGTWFEDLNKIYTAEALGINLSGNANYGRLAAVKTRVHTLLAQKAADELTYLAAIGITETGALSVTQNLTLARNGAYGTTITWSSNVPSVVAIAGTVNRPEGADATVILTATITKGSSPVTKNFPVTVSMKPKLDAPLATPVSGQVAFGTLVSLYASAGADIYYTTGTTSTPTINSTKYTTAIPINAAVTIKAIAVKDGMSSSNVATFSYTLKTAPVITGYTVAPGTALGSTKITYSTIGKVVKYVKQTNAFTTPYEGQTAPVNAQSFVSGIDINSCVAGDHIGLFELGIGSKVVKFIDITLQASHILSQSVAPNAVNIAVSNRVGSNDTVVVTGLAAGDIVKVYSAATGGFVLGQETVASGSTMVTIRNLNLLAIGGTIHVSVTSSNILESARTPKTYSVESDVQHPLVLESANLNVLPGVYVVRVVLRNGVSADNITATVDGVPMEISTDYATGNVVFYKQVAASRVNPELSMDVTIREAASVPPGVEVINNVNILPAVYVARIVLENATSTEGLTVTIDGIDMLEGTDQTIGGHVFYQQVSQDEVNAQMKFTLEVIS
jgi:hypothetical protein